MQHPAPAFSNTSRHFSLAVFVGTICPPSGLVFDGMHREMNPFPALQWVSRVFRRSEAEASDYPAGSL